MNSCDPFFFSCHRGDKIHSPNTNVMYRIWHCRSPVDENIRRTRRAKISHKRALNSWFIGKTWRGYLPINFCDAAVTAQVYCACLNNIFFTPVGDIDSPTSTPRKEVVMHGEDACGMVFFLSAYWFVPFSSFGRISTTRKKEVTKVITVAVRPICMLDGHCLPCQDMA